LFRYTTAFLTNVRSQKESEKQQVTGFILYVFYLVKHATDGRKKYLCLLNGTVSCDFSPLLFSPEENPLPGLMNPNLTWL
jgi:hypothetical protein